MRRVRSRTLALLATIGALAGCRGIVGIEELTLDDAGARDAAPDQAPADAGTDAADANVNPCWSNVGPPCGRCCKESNGNAIQQLESAGKTSGCICGDGGLCRTECTTTTCGPGGMPDETCAPCLDDALLSPSPPCAQARAACTSAACGSLIACMEGCR